MRRAGEKEREWCTSCLASLQRSALIASADGKDVDVVLGLRLEVGEGELGPGWRQALVLGTAASGRLVAQAVATDAGAGSAPVDGERVGGDLGELEVSGGVQNCLKGEKRKDR